ncbi:MAG: hypothetical protein ACRDKW_18340, partial [Actinomycetota bacterium]
MRPRRRIRRVLTVLALLGGIVPLTASTSYTLTVPETLHALVPLGGGQGAGPRAIGPTSVAGAAREAAPPAVRGTL